MALSLFSIQSSLGNSRKSSYYIIILHSRRGRTRRFSEWTRPEEFEGENAYDILGVAESSTFAEIKASFLKLAKQTHPDLASSTTDSSSPHQRFIQILAAYEILSDSVKRAHYDKYLLSQRKLIQNQRHLRQGSTLYVYRSRMTAGKHMEVVEWLKWYRMAINDIVSEKKVAVGTGYFDVLEADFYSAICMAYYGPEIESLDLLPDCFEAEERSFYETPEVLHLVSGRDLFGMVSLVNEIPEISSSCSKKLEYCASSTLEISQSNVNASISISSNILDNGIPTMHAENNASQTADAYKDLELHVSGRVVAFATRVPPKKRQDRLQNEDNEDQINVFLCLDGYSTTSCQTFSENSLSNAAVGSRIPLGTIKGLRTRPEEGSCFVYDSSGAKTHVIMKHRTLLVKHMHFYGVGDKVSVCECRCSRAQLPPSKFWLFEPRCGMHDIGGWYVETFGSDKKGRTIPSQRFWDGLDRSERCDKRLHPAMYLLALAYRTLDLEDARRSKRTIRHIVEGQLFRVLHWCKKLV